MSDRKNIPVDEAIFERLKAQKGEDDTWNDVGARAADALEADADGDTGAEDGCTQTARIPTEQVEEIARMAGVKAADEVEDRLTGR
ncbi:hypothetical protein [Halobellus rubicundus]|uniref:CopG family transcriptional regulator n=1 Tax=Halobellus rubicundus TaxID=2996466 RepID=A0ABD5MDT9_9EURY